MNFGPVLAILAGLALFGGAMQDTPPVDPAPETPQEDLSRTGWLRKMYSTDRCAFGDGLRMIASVLKGEHVKSPYQIVCAYLSEAGDGILEPSWTLEEGDKLTKGHLGYMLCRAFRIKGGVTMRLAGTSRRYGLRECVYLGLITPGTVDEYVSGRELLDVYTRAEIFRKEGSLNSLRKP